MSKIQLSTTYGTMKKPIEEMDDDELIFWMLFTRDGIVAMRNANEEGRLNDAIRGEEKEYENLLDAVKDRMRKGGKSL